MRFGKTTPIFIIMLAVLAGGLISQIPSALGDNSDTNPFGALWDAIFDLQSKDKNLQAQIDELKAERDDGLSGSSVQAGEPAALASDAYARIRVETATEGDGQSSSSTIVYITAGNNGPDRAAGIKLTTFYLMPLFQINSIDSSSGDDDLCEDKSRGIIECTLGTLEAGQESLITIHATAREFGKANTWTVDISTTTKDTDYTNNHVTYNFETGSSATPIQQQPPTNESGIDEPQETEPEQNGLDNNNNSSSNSTDADTSAEQTANNDSANQTSAETAQATAPSTGSNGTGTEQGSSGEEEASEEEQVASSSSEESNGEGSSSGSSASSEQAEDSGDDQSSETGSESSTSSSSSNSSSEEPAPNDGSGGDDNASEQESIAQ